MHSPIISSLPILFQFAFINLQTPTEPGPETTSAAVPILIVLLLGSLAEAAFLFYQKHGLTAPVPPSLDPFSEQLITQTFVSALPTLTRELNLEVATSYQVETLERTDSRKVWGIHMGTNQVNLRTPVTYRYHLRLTDPWCLSVKGKTILVKAPVIRPSQPPAIHTDQLQIESRRGWGRLPPHALAEQLHHDLTPTLVQYAGDSRRMHFIRETARQSVAEFVRLWLEKENRWNKGSFTAIHVHLAGEQALPSAPTLQLDT